MPHRHPPPSPYLPGKHSSPRVLLKRLREIMAESLSAQQKLDQITKAIAYTMVADVCSIYLRRADDRLELFSTVGLKAQAVHKTKLDWGEGLVGKVARSSAPLNLSRASEHADFSFRSEVGEEKLNAFLGVPILRTGKVLGVLVIQNKSERRYLEEEVEAAQSVAMILAEVVAYGELLEEKDAVEMKQILLRPEHFKGTPVVTGVVIGTAVRHDPPPPEHKTFADSVPKEVERLKEGLGRLQKNIDVLIAKNAELSGVSREVLEVYRLFAYDKGWRRRLEDAVLSGLTAESAVEQVHEENRKRMRQVTDPYLRERLHDLDDLTRRLQRVLTGQDNGEALELPDNAVLLADSLGPAELLELDRQKLKAIVLGEGSDNSHLAIVARGLGLPMVGGLPQAIDLAQSGDKIIVDGQTGEVHLRPQEETIAVFESKRIFLSEAQAEYDAEKDLPCVSRDGVEAELMMNAGLLVDLPHLEKTGAVGVGLFRTELQFLIGNNLPTSAEQEAIYRKALEQANGKPVVFRTTDLGSDKAADYMEMEREANPAMGWRGVRMTIDREGLMRPQLRALLAAAAGQHLYILLPFVTTEDEVITAREIIDKEIERRRKNDRLLPEKISIGVMIETPASAWRTEEIARHVDFLSIGGNDMAQFFFAADRESARLSNRYDFLHPSYLDFLRMISAKAKRAEIPLGYCGEQAGDPLMAMSLIGIGITRLSVPAPAVGPIKRLIRAMDVKDFSSWLAPKIELAKVSLRPSIMTYALERGLPL